MRTVTREFVEMSAEGDRLPHMPALDGLRGLAVAGVLAFHAGMSVMVGGFLGVSTFFTLSGFLITSLLLRESRSTGGVALRRFWSRRLRRLLPAALVTLVGVLVLFGPLVATPLQRSGLRGDSLSALFDVSNWWFLSQGSSYGDLFVMPSPVLHFWSLSIEEQFYVVLPLLLAVLLGRSARGARARGADRRGGADGTRRAVVVLGLLAVASAALPLVVDMSVDRVYFGTDTRAVEILVGALLAVALSSRELRRRLALRTPYRNTLALGAVAVLALQLVAWWTVDQSSGWLYRGGLAVYSIGSAVVIAAAVLPRGPLRAALAVGPLRWLGERSYGIYLFHWPLFLAARQLHPDAAPGLRALAATAVTLVLAEMSYRWIERPIRVGGWPRGRLTVPVAVGSVAVVALLAWFLPAEDDGSGERIDFDAALERFEEGGDTGAGDVTGDTEDAEGTSSTTTTVGEEPAVAPEPRVATFGDSTALLSAIGLANHRALHGGDAEILGEVELGCSIARFEAVRFDVVIPTTDTCRAWPLVWPGSLEREDPDIAQVVTGAWEVPDVRLPGADEFTSLGDPATDAFVLDELRLAADVLSAEGALVLFVLWPEIGPWAAEGRSEAYRRQADPARMERLHELMRQVARERPDHVRVLDFAGWLGERSQDPTLRPDGVHLTEAQMTLFYEAWLADEIDRIWQDWWAEHGAPAEGDAG